MAYPGFLQPLKTPRFPVPGRWLPLKYYGTSVKVLGNKLPPNFENEFSKTIADASFKLEKVIKNISQSAGAKMKKKGFTKNNSEPNYEEYLLVEIVNRAMTKVFENKGLMLQK